MTKTCGICNNGNTTLVTFVYYFGYFS